MQGHGQKQSPDRGGGIDHGRNVARHRALTPGEKGEGNGVIEQRDGDQPGQQAARRQLMATQPENCPQQTRSQGAAQKRNPKRRKSATRYADHEEGNSPNSGKQKYLKNRPDLHSYTMTSGKDRV